MNRLLFKSMGRQKTKNILTILAFTVIFVFLPLLISSLQTIKSQVETDITFHARGSYDLLVRPLGAEHQLEIERGIVPENFIGFGKGGISIEQWEAIKESPDIEIAAPVASLGYFAGMKSNIGYDAPESSSKYTTQYFTSDGLNEYPITEEYICFLLESPQTVETHIGIVDDFENLFNHIDLLNSCVPTVAMAPLPPTYHLLVGIDPAEEESLTGIHFKGINSENPSKGEGYGLSRSFPGTPVIPVLQLEKGDVSLFARSEVETIPVSKEQTMAFRDEMELDDDYVYETKDGVLHQHGSPHFTSYLFTDDYNKLLRKLSALQSESEQSYNLDLGNRLDPYRQEAILIGENGELDQLLAGGEAGYVEDLDLSYSSQYYEVGHVTYEQEGEELVIKKIGEENGVPLYREVIRKGRLTTTEAYENDLSPPFIIDPVGEFHFEGQDMKLASSPLGIYSQYPATYIGNGEGNEVLLRPTVMPGSFVSAAASGVTNIQAAALIKGDKPIDAIRVKVADIDGYTVSAAEKIDHIAGKIRDTGLQVSIIAGASPQFLEVDVEEVGLIRESWTTLGAAGTIIDQWNLSNLILAISFLAISLIYIINRVRFWQLNKQSEMLLLSQLGWRKRDIVGAARKEGGFLVVVAWMISFAILFSFYEKLDVGEHLFLSLIAVGIIAIGLLLVLISRKIKSVFSEKDQTSGHLSTHGRPKTLVLKNISYFRRFHMLSFIQLLMVGALASFVYLSLTETVRETNATLLGEYVNIQVSNWQTLLIGSVYMLAFVTLVESLLSLLRIRKNEISTLLTLGWKVSDVFKLFIKEIVLVAGIAISLGGIFSLLIYSMLYSINSEVWGVLMLSSVGFFVISLIVSSITIYGYVKKEI